MTARVHKECDIMDQDELLRLQGAWESPEHKDECVVCMNYFERDYWMGTEVGQLEGLSLVVWASRSNFWRRWVVQRWHDGFCKFQGKRPTNVHESAEKRKARVRAGQSWGELC
jgi:hypothetical protein